ncbi:transaldolase/Fructose-6-phosphate aldolase domain-containing protein [Hirsutella rhossiliensis]|uniref:Transaldolase n=1 Tax=Hirsutella rhossiliensis TaxID=111463 RepID=A0A9P8N0T1_9HYPO|nr:transaldolase/Fructose-6-phosphate aldolase domain-containing protein [Hirsutella rhossiliensis]KAH0964810.1 transaldolase/Fructose-6-phosphate aldolase domain-containing protein [Hirsutella rhossiliensis]
MPSLLDALREASQVDCDTLDSQVAERLGPFVDCTSNQAIAFFELSRPVSGDSRLHHAELIKSAISEANGPLQRLQGLLSLEAFAVEVLMVKLQLRIAPNVTGRLHVQTNPKFSYSTAASVENAERILAIFGALAPDLDPRKVCIKIPATWEGLQACRAVEAKGIATLATTMFCMEQAVLAADAGCTYIAPYVNELKVHFEHGFVDDHKAFDLCREAQTYFRDNAHRTRVVAASLTSVDEVMQLAGLDHITVSPGLLHKLAARDASSWSGSPGAYVAADPDKPRAQYRELVANEAAWRLAFTRSGFGTSEGKMVQVINYFADFDEKLEALVKQLSEPDDAI